MTGEKIKGKIDVSNGSINIDGRPTRIISGTLHYFRIHPDQWRDRIAKAKMMGLNAVETYVCHNLHEPRPGEFDFSGMLDLPKFLEEIHAQGMYAIVRPGPYICAEWENGGLPAWMMTLPGIRFRCMNGPYIEAYNRYLNTLLPLIRPSLYTCGGPVILMQIENEYGSYGCDKQYLEHTRKLYLENGIDVPLVTSDGPADFMLNGGTLPGCVQTVNFGSRAVESFAVSRKHRPEGPDFCMEFWNGWFDHWGEPHHTRDSASVAKELDDMLKMGASVNFYVFCGGTNFGFMNGANGNGLKPDDYAPTVTSYDYDSPLTEWGDPTPKFFECQAVIRKYREDAEFGTPSVSKKIAPGEVKFTGSARLADHLGRIGECHESVMPETMEHYGQNYGFILYRTTVRGPVAGQSLMLFNLRDRAVVHLNGRYVGTVYRNDKEQSIPCEIPEGDNTLDILVENMGRINYGPKVGYDTKGISGVGINLQQQSCFKTWTLPLDDPGKLTYGAFCAEENIPAFHRGEFMLDTPADTFVEFPGVKGVVYVNGFNLGRYWNIGPGNTLYVPAPILRKGRNEIVVFELHKLKTDGVFFTDTPQLD